MKKFYFLLLLLILLGCQQSGPSSVDLFQGREGVSISFGTNTPPGVVYEGTPFNMAVNINNRGASNSVGRIIFEFDNFYFSATGALQKDFVIGGKSFDFPRGQMTFLVGPEMSVRNIEGTRANVDSIVGASICYKYRTHFTDAICIDSDIFGTRTGRGCRVQDSKSYSSQGAPVAVTNVRPSFVPVEFESTQIQTTTPVINEFGELDSIGSLTSIEDIVMFRPVFEITIRNVGPGLVYYSSDGLDACMRSSQRTAGKIIVRANLSNQDLDCSPDPIILKDREVVITCVGETFTATGSYDAFLNMEIDYFYTDQISQSININRFSR